ncbi:hypothetical protein LOD99_3852 [Oopsacas minuta]|uniref:Ubiquitin conjugation factor E4 core domain-containing protein n=1 Tax=Oopsacas minuta TaxID=111878 RepID=A0AAV7JWH7_9METZ|nr:hypothetical protein LOD99_3852 [Oopsacas minuta]
MVDDSINCLSFLLECKIIITGHTPLPSNDNYTQVCRLSSVTELPTQDDDVTRKFQSIFLRRVALEYDEIKFVILTFKRTYLHSNRESPLESTPFQNLRVVAREVCIDRILTQLMSLSSESDTLGEDSLWMSVANQNAGSHDSRFLSALRHLTGCDTDTSPLPDQLLPTLAHKLGESDLGISALIRMLRAGCEQIRGVESLEKVASRHQVVFPPVETLVSLQECSHTIAHQLIKEVKERSADTGKYYSHSSCLSELLGYSIIMPSINVKYLNNSCYIPLKSLPGYPRDFQRMLQNSNTLKQQNSEYTHKLCKLTHAILKKILRNSDKHLKSAPLIWLSDVINSHQLLTTPKFMRGKEEQLVAHPGWRLNFCYLLLLFCEPFFSRSANQKLSLIAIDYVISKECRLDLPNESCLARGVIPPRTDTNTQSNANFITEIFHFTLRALNLLLIAPMNQAMQVVSDLSKAAHNMSPESPERERLEELSGLTFITWDLTILNEQFALMVSQFYITAGIWLNMSIESNQLIEALSHIPEFLIKDSCQWFRFLVTSSPNLFRLLEMAPVIDLYVLLLERQDLMPGPVSQSKVVSFLLSLVQTQLGSISAVQLSTSWSSVHGELATILHSNPTVRDKLGPALLSCYTAVDVVEGLDVDKDSFDKFSARQDITNLITHLWNRQDCRDSVLRQCNTSLFPAFLNSILDTLLYMLNDSIHRLRNARLIQISMEEDSWSRLTPREQRAKQDFLSSEERVTRGFLSISQTALSLLQVLSESADVSSILSQQPLCHRVASAFIGQLLLLFNICLCLLGGLLIWR